MAASNKVFQVTLTSSGTTFDLNSINIIQVWDAVAGGAHIIYLDNKELTSTIEVDELPSDISTAAGNLFSATIDGVSMYLNPDRVILIEDNASEAYIHYNIQADSPKILSASESRTTLRTRIAAVVPDGTGEFVDLTSAQTIAGVKTFSDALVTSTINRGSVANAITAFAGGGQAGATPVTEELNVVTTVATIGDSVLLPTPNNTSGGEMLVIYNGGGNSCDVFPHSGGKINGGGANAAIALAAAAVYTFRAIDDANWVAY